MRILLLGDINASHLRKWAQACLDEGMAIAVFSLARPRDNWHEGISGLSVCIVPGGANPGGREIWKLSYLKSQTRLRSFIRHFSPDILHAHYMTSYGLLALLSRFRPYVVSPWGTDIMEFPLKGPVHSLLIRKILRSASSVHTPGKVLADYVLQYSDHRSRVIPFGVDVQRFCPMPVQSLFPKESLVVGTVKSMEEVYGIDTLIRAFARLPGEIEGKAVRLLLVGGGSKTEVYRTLANGLGLGDRCHFTGRIAPEEVQRYHNMMDVFVNMSLRESFGVSVLEASACGKPVVASDTGGLREVVEDGYNGYLVPVGDETRLSVVLMDLLKDRPLRDKLGRQGRERVLACYDWAVNARDIPAWYKEQITRGRRPS